MDIFTRNSGVSQYATTADLDDFAGELGENISDRSMRKQPRHSVGRNNPRPPLGFEFVDAVGDF